MASPASSRIQQSIEDLKTLNTLLSEATLVKGLSRFDGTGMGKECLHCSELASIAHDKQLCSSVNTLRTAALALVAPSVRFHSISVLATP